MTKWHKLFKQILIQVFALTVLPCSINLMVNDNDPINFK